MNNAALDQIASEKPADQDAHLLTEFMVVNCMKNGFTGKCLLSYSFSQHMKHWTSMCACAVSP